jgi:hypothetical protein
MAITLMPDTKTIKVRRVNLRGGPGENYSVLGRLEKGAVKEIKIGKGLGRHRSANECFAYVAAEFLEMQPAPAIGRFPAARPRRNRKWSMSTLPPRRP